MIVLTEKVLRHHLNSQEVVWLDRSLRDNNDQPVENMKTQFLKIASKWQILAVQKVTMAICNLYGPFQTISTL